jgi:isopentenyl-diphosphate delta-isomerase
LINRNLAQAAQRLGIGMGLGSQRAMLEDPELTSTYLVRDVAPSILLLGNIGAVQVSYYSVDRIREMIERVGADGLAVHLNPVQELVQPEGDTDWGNVLPSLERLCRELEWPVVVKEVGCGISREIAMKLESVGVSCIDVAGAGGTCFAKVEEHRGSETAKIFSRWGIPTADALRQCAEATTVPLIASGGMRSGLDCAKALAMGASLVSFALPLLKAAVDSSDAVCRVLESFASELKKTMLLAGASTLDELKKATIRKVTG